MSCKVGNQTNSQDPQAVNSRVFVGNLNTFQCSKTDVERRFQRYGRIAGISMHKGYAFIQFTNPFDARSACLGEDARLLWGQTLDVNMVAEPKSHQTGRKRQNVAKTGNDWDYYYDSLKLQLESLYHSYYAQVGFPTPRLVPPLKRARIHVPPLLNPRSIPGLHKALPYHNNKAITASSATTSISELKSYSTPDILICGNCRELYSDVEQLMEHKKSYCKLRFTCKCHTRNGCTTRSLGEEPAALLCSLCKDSFHTAWDLMVHVQAAHMLNIYQLGDADTKITISEQTETGLEEDGVGSESGTVANEFGTLLNDMEDSDSHSESHNGENNSRPPPEHQEPAFTSPSHSSGEGPDGSNGNGNGSIEVDPTTTTSTENGRETPERVNGLAFTFPMEASTQTPVLFGSGTNNTTPPPRLGMDNPNNFDETCGLHLLATVNGTGGLQYSFANVPTAIENNT